MPATSSGPDSIRGGIEMLRRSFPDLHVEVIWRVADGQLVETWGVADRFELLQQLGIIPSDDELATKIGPPG